MLMLIRRETALNLGTLISFHSPVALRILLYLVQSWCIDHDCQQARGGRCCHDNGKNPAAVNPAYSTPVGGLDVTAAQGNT